MARLHDPTSDTSFTLGARVLVGRGPDATLRIAHRRVSSEHAVIAFDGEGWSIRDLGSRNGTRLDGRPLPVGRPVPLAAGATIEFAEQIWRLVDDGDPRARARAGDTARAAEDGMLVLPELSDPQVTVFPTRAGRWLAEVDGTPRYVSDGDVVEVGGVEWTLELPPVDGLTVVEATVGTVGAAPRSLTSLVELQLSPSLDEESVRTVLRFADGELEIPPRAAHLVLLHLARERLADAARGLVAAEQGWVYAEVLGDALDMDPQRLNVEVYRARKQFTQLGIAGAAELFERRTQTRQIRLGVERVMVAEAGD